MTRRKNSTLAFFIILVITIFTALILYVGIIKPMQASNLQKIKINGIVLTPAQVISHFELTDQNEQKFNKDSLKGRWTFMFFGFTNCGMVCPTSMAALSQTYQILQKELPDNQLPQVVLVTVDPDRDTTAKMKSYVNAFNKNFLGARADITETVKLEKQLHIAAAKIEADGTGKNHYTIEHTADILLFNPKAELQAIFSYPPKPLELAKDYKLILKSGSSS